MKILVGILSLMLFTSPAWGANVLNRASKQYIRSANTPEYPPGQWVINPDLSSVVGVPRRYWKITGDIVSPMNAAERQVVDIARVITTSNQRKARISARLSVQERVVVSAILVLLNEINSDRPPSQRLTLQDFEDKVLTEMEK